MSPPSATRGALHVPEMASGTGLRVSLIPTAGGKTSGRPIRVLVLATLGALLLSGIVAGMLVWRAKEKQQEIAALEVRARAAIEATRAGKQAFTEAQVVGRQLKNIRTVLKNHVVWSQFFAFLETYTHHDVVYTQFASEGFDTVTLQTEAKDFSALAEHVQALSTAPFMQEVRLSGMSGDFLSTGQLKKVKLTMTLHFSPTLLSLGQGAPSGAQ